MTGTPVPFTIDRAYDRAQASDGVSRYGRYLRYALAADGDHIWDFEPRPTVSTRSPHSPGGRPPAR